MTNTVWRVLKKLKIELLYDLAIPLLHIYQKKIKSLPKKKKNLHSHVQFIYVLSRSVMSTSLQPQGL